MSKQSELLNELQENRKRLQKLSEDLEKLAERVDDLIPKEYKPTTRFILEDRVRIITTLYDSLLRYKSEIGRAIEKEIELVSLIDNESEITIADISNISTTKVQEMLSNIEKKLSKIESTSNNTQTTLE